MPKRIVIALQPGDAQALGADTFVALDASVQGKQPQQQLGTTTTKPTPPEGQGQHVNVVKQEVKR